MIQGDSYAKYCVHKSKLIFESLKLQSILFITYFVLNLTFNNFSPTMLGVVHKKVDK